MLLASSDSDACVNEGKSVNKDSPILSEKNPKSPP